MAVKTLVKRRMISKKKKKTPAQRLLEMMQKHDMSQEQVQQTLALSTLGGGALSPMQREIMKLPPLKVPTIKTRKTRKRAEAKLKITKSLGGILSSSFINYLEWEGETNNVFVAFHNRKYTFKNVPESVFVSWWEGNATATTDESGKRKRWWIGKTPSLGAFFNQRIKNKYTYVKGWVGN